MKYTSAEIRKQINNVEKMVLYFKDKPNTKYSFILKLQELQTKLCSIYNKKTREEFYGNLWYDSSSNPPATTNVAAQAATANITTSTGFCNTLIGHATNAQLYTIPKPRQTEKSFFSTNYTNYLIQELLNNK